MRKEIKIDPQGGIVSTNVEVRGLVAAGYHLELYEVRSNNVIFYYSGTNEYDDDDFRWLPNSADKNVGRVILLDTTVSSLDEEVDGETEFSVSLQVFQNDEILDEAVYKNKLEKHHESLMIIVKLV